MKVERIMVWKDNLYLVLEKMQCSLKMLMDTYKEVMEEPFSEFEAAFILHEVLHALHRLHRHALLHPDLRP